MRIYFLAIILSPFLVSCADTPTPESLEDVIWVTKPTQLSCPSGNIKNTQYKIKSSNVLLDLNGCTLVNNTGRSSIVYSSRFKNVQITNGTLDLGDYATGIVVARTLKFSEYPKLLENSETFPQELWARSNVSGSYISNITFKQGLTGVYVQNYVKGLGIKNNKFLEQYNMGVYVDASSQETNISNNYFLNNGFKNEEDKWNRRRGAISIDGSMYNKVVNNIFETTKYRSSYLSFLKDKYPVPEIELYRNYGEQSEPAPFPFPRLHGADHNLIEGNEFKIGNNLAMWFAYRSNGRNIVPESEVIYPDKADNNIARNNIFNPESTRYKDDGVGNSY